MRIPLFVMCVLLLSACTTPTTQGTNGCYAQGKDLVTNSNVSAKIVNKGDTTEVSQDSFNATQLEDLQFGYTIKRTTQGIYVGYELCDLADNTIVDDSMFLEEPGNLIQDEFGSTTGSYQDFYYTDGEGNQKSYLTHSGDYSVNVFTSGDGESWELTAQRGFTLTN